MNQKLVRKGPWWVVLEPGKPKRRFDSELAARAYMKPEQIVPKTVYVEEETSFDDIDFGEPFEQED